MEICTRMLRLRINWSVRPVDTQRSTVRVGDSSLECASIGAQFDTFGRCLL